MFDVEIYDRDNHEIGAATLNFDDTIQLLSSKDVWKSLYLVVKSKNV
jgi:hypothetical protein